MSSWHTTSCAAPAPSAKSATAPPRLCSRRGSNLRPSFDVDERQELHLRQLGLDDVTLRSVMWSPAADHPEIVIEDERPTLDAERMVAAAKAGLHLLVQSESDFNLETIRDSLPHFTGIDIRQGGGSVRNVALLSEALALRTLRAFDITSEVDLSTLPNLESVWAIGDMCWSAALNPGLRELIVDDARAAPGLEVVAPLTKLVLDRVRGVSDLSFLRDVSRLDHVGIVDVARMDLTALAGAHRLRSLYLSKVKVLVGVEHLASLDLMTLSSDPNHMLADPALGRPDAQV